MVKVCIGTCAQKRAQTLIPLYNFSFKFVDPIGGMKVFKKVLILLTMLGCISHVFGQSEEIYSVGYEEESRGELQNFENLNVLGIFDRTDSPSIHDERAITIRRGSTVMNQIIEEFPARTTKLINLAKIETAPSPFSAVITPLKLGSVFKEPLSESSFATLNAKAQQHSCNVITHAIPHLSEEEDEQNAVVTYFAAECVMLNDDDKAKWTVDIRLNSPSGNYTTGSAFKKGANITIHDFETRLTLACDGASGVWTSHAKFVVKPKGKGKTVIYNNNTHANLCE